MVETYFQAVKLVAAPNYPNAVAWSDENLIAVASGPLVTILVSNLFLHLPPLISKRTVLTFASPHYLRIRLRLLEHEALLQSLQVIHFE